MHSPDVVQNNPDDFHMPPAEPKKMSDSMARVLRTLFQLIAAGALTGLIEQLARDLDPAYGPYLLLLNVLIVSFAQNFGEQAGLFPVLFRPQGSTSRAAEAVQRPGM